MAIANRYHPLDRRPRAVARARSSSVSTTSTPAHFYASGSGRGEASAALRGATVGFGGRRDDSERAAVGSVGARVCRPRALHAGRSRNRYAPHFHGALGPGHSQPRSPARASASAARPATTALDARSSHLHRVLSALAAGASLPTPTASWHRATGRDSEFLATFWRVDITDLALQSQSWCCLRNRRSQVRILSGALRLWSGLACTLAVSGPP